MEKGKKKSSTTKRGGSLNIVKVGLICFIAYQVVPYLSAAPSFITGVLVGSLFTIVISTIVLGQKLITVVRDRFYQGSGFREILPSLLPKLLNAFLEERMERMFMPKREEPKQEQRKQVPVQVQSTPVQATPPNLPYPVGSKTVVKTIHASFESVTFPLSIPGQDSIHPYLNDEGGQLRVLLTGCLKPVCGMDSINKKRICQIHVTPDSMKWVTDFNKIVRNNIYRDRRESSSNYTITPWWYSNNGNVQFITVYSDFVDEIVSSATLFDIIIRLDAVEFHGKVRDLVWKMESCTPQVE